MQNTNPASGPVFPLKRRRSTKERDQEPRGGLVSNSPSAN